MPVKLKEYLAAGLPVVATPMAEVKRFAEHHPSLVRFAADPAGFVAALRASLADDSAEMSAHRITVARQFDWNYQMARMKELIEQALAPAVSTAAPVPTIESR
jgi:glycosyltransferase involved in cell wall biosynthesis